MASEIFLRLKHECTFLEFANNFGRKSIYHYCNSINDYLVIPEKLSEQKVNLVLDVFGGINNLLIKKIGLSSELTFISMDCPCNYIYQNNITKEIIELKGNPIFPIKYLNGFEYWSIYFKSDILATNFILKMEGKYEIEILNREKLGDEWMVSQTVVLDKLIEELTYNQIETLIKAYEGGYYNIPRNIKTKEIALKNNITRYAVDRSIRSAENKILNYIMPFIYLRRSNLSNKSKHLEKIARKNENL